MTFAKKYKMFFYNQTGGKQHFRFIKVKLIVITVHSLCGMYANSINYL